MSITGYFTIHMPANRKSHFDCHDCMMHSILLQFFVSVSLSVTVIIWVRRTEQIQWNCFFFWGGGSRSYSHPILYWIVKGFVFTENKDSFPVTLLQLWTPVVGLCLQPTDVVSAVQLSRVISDTECVTSLTTLQHHCRDSRLLIIVQN